MIDVQYDQAKIVSPVFIACAASFIDVQIE